MAYRKKAEPERIDYAIYQIHELGYDISFVNDKRIEFDVLGHLVIFYPYSGWHTGKSIKDGRGLINLLNQL